MEPNKKFQHLSYNLSENILYHNLKYSYKHLIFLSTFKICSAFYKDPRIIARLKQLLETEGNTLELVDLILHQFEEHLPLSVKTVVEPYLPLIKKIIGIMQNEICVFIKDLKVVYSSYFMRWMVFTNQGTVNFKRTVCEVLERENSLSQESKFKLACKYFLGDKLILNCFKKLPIEVQNYYIFHEEIDDRIYDSIHFWIFRIKHLDKSIENDSTQIRANDEIKWHIDSDFIKEKFYKAIRKQNGMEIQYIWESFVTKMSEKDEILHDILPNLLKFKNINFFIYFLFQIESNRGGCFNEFFKSMGFEILKKIYQQERWHNIFIEVFEILHVHLDENTHMEIINLLIDFSTGDKKLNLYFLKGISEVLGSIFKKHLANKMASSYHSILKDLMQNQRLQTVEAVFKIIGKRNFNIFLDTEGVKCFEIPIKFGCFNYVDKVVRNNFMNHDIFRLKIKLKQRMLPICCNLVENNYLGGIKKFLKWLFDHKKVKNKIKSLLHESEFVRSLICKELYGEDFTIIDNFLLSCFRSEEAVIKYKKKLVLESVFFSNQRGIVVYYKDIRDLVLSRKFQYLDRLLKWCLFTDKRIKTLKNWLLRDDNILLAILFRGNLREFLNPFVDFCTNNPIEIIEFQTKMLSNIALFSALIEKGNFYGAKELIDWCGEYLEEEAQELKKELFPLVITNFVCHSRNKKEYEDFKEWINISWSTFMKSHFTAIGPNIFQANKNFLNYHIHFLTYYYRNIKNCL